MAPAAGGYSTLILASRTTRPHFSLSRVMIADKDGRVGEVISVRDEPKGKPIFVRIVEPGRATILSN